MSVEYVVFFEIHGKVRFTQPPDDTFSVEEKISDMVVDLTNELRAIGVEEIRHVGWHTEQVPDTSTEQANNESE